MVRAQRLFYLPTDLRTDLVSTLQIIWETGLKSIVYVVAGVETTSRNANGRPGDHWIRSKGEAGTM